MRCLALLSALTAAMLLLLGVGAAGATAPSNDNFANATAISSLPFSDQVDITDATIESGEPINNTYYMGRTVWYSFTPSANAVVQIAPNFPYHNYPTLCDLQSNRFLVVYRESSTGFAGLVAIAGYQWGSASTQTISVQAGTTYYVQGGQVYGMVPSCGENDFGVSVHVVPPPPNDDFANAIAFNAVPFSDSKDLTAATIQPGEPMACGTNLGATVWYAFTPTVSGSYGTYPGIANVNVYSGTSLTNLTSIACSQYWGMSFHADAGTTYYLQSYGGGVSIDLLPPPYVEYYYNPTDPSVFDTVGFGTGYYDPRVTTQTWDFGDGTSGLGSSPTHRFTADGDYSVTFTEATADGLSAHQTQTVQVRTHDVTILSIVAPGKSMVGKQGTVTVGIGNTRYPETVQVDLYKASPQGDVAVGTSVQSVGVMKLKKAVTFSFNYVFTTDDAIVGKVAFKAVATIQGQRDANPGDNTATAPAVLVTK